MTISAAQPCDRLVELMPDLLDDSELLSEVDAAHVAQCLRCQAEMARFRRIARTMASFREIPVAADPAVLDTVLDTILEGLDSAAERRERHRIAGRRAASIVGLAAATAAGVGGVLVLATRRRSA